MLRAGLPAAAIGAVGAAAIVAAQARSGVTLDDGLRWWAVGLQVAGLGAIVAGLVGVRAMLAPPSSSADGRRRAGGGAPWRWRREELTLDDVHEAARRLGVASSLGLDDPPPDLVHVDRRVAARRLRLQVLGALLVAAGAVLGSV